MSSARAPLEVFIAYAHADQALKDELLKHLSPLKRRGLVEHWHDRRIDAGAEWAEEIDARLESAHIILLLISPDFLHSDFCYQKEMARALERHAAGECRVIPVFLRACDWKGLSFGKLQGLPDDAIPVVSDRWPSRDEALTRVALGIRIIVEKWHAGDAATPVPSRMGERARQTQPVSGAPPVIESELGVIDDSGAAVLLADQYFESDSITEQEHGRVEVRIAPLSAEEDAALRSLKGERPISHRRGELCSWQSRLPCAGAFCAE
jgi:TIR domain